MNVNREELVIIFNCLREASELVNDFEFDSLIGGSRDDVRRLMDKLRPFVDQVDSFESGSFLLKPNRDV